MGLLARKHRIYLYVTHMLFTFTLSRSTVTAGFLLSSYIPSVVLSPNICQRNYYSKIIIGMMITTYH